jgi:hypothetical protein
MFKKAIILSLYFLGRSSISSLGQTSQGCTLMEPCHYNQLVTAIQQKLPFRQDNTNNCSEYLDSLCLRFMVQDLKDAKQPNGKSVSPTLQVFTRYPRDPNPIK